MSLIDDQLHLLDPVRHGELDRASRHPVFDELRVAILTGAADATADVVIERASVREHAASAPRGRRPSRRALVGAVALLVVVAAAVAAVWPPGARTAGRAPSWQLVSKVTAAPSWQVVGSASYRSGLELACPSSKTCLVADVSEAASGTSVIEVTHDGGATWALAALPDELAPTTPIDCAAVTTCFVGGQDALGHDALAVTVDGGESWALLSLAPSNSSPAELSSVSCASVERCVVTETSGSPSDGPSTDLVTSDGGSTWRTVDFAAGFVPARLACQTTGRCIVGGSSDPSLGVGAVLLSRDGGLTWTPANVPAGVGAINSVWCSSAGDVCLASAIGPVDQPVAGTVLRSTDGGQTWRSATGLGVTDAFWTSLACATTASCWGAGLTMVPSAQPSPIFGASRDGLLASTADLGEHWRPASLPVTPALVAAISVTCPSATQCYALGIQRSSDEDATIVLLGHAG